MSDNEIIPKDYLITLANAILNALNYDGALDNEDELFK
jgi:hypothetical protein